MQIPENANIEAIKRARKQMSFRVHPDRCRLPNAKEAFHRVNEAADALMQQRA
jgi:curved DNA-binding protein CbpA